MLGLVKLLFYKLKNRNMKIYESENQIVYRGLYHDLIKKHIDSKTEKVLCVYDTKENFLQEDFSYNSDWLAFYEIYDSVQDEWIIERHSKLEDYTNFTSQPWGIMRNSKKGG